MRKGLGISLLAALGLGGCSNTEQLAFVGFLLQNTKFGEPYAVTLGIVNPSGDPLTWSLLESPAGMTLTGGDIAWMPDYDDLGMHTVRVRAETADDSDETMFQVRVHQGLDQGLTLSPRGHTQSSNFADWMDHYQNSGPYGRVLAAHTNWRDFGDFLGQIPDAAASTALAADQYGFTPAFGFGWADGDGVPDLLSATEPTNNTWSNVETRNEYRTMVSNFAQFYQPRYVFLGNEVNTYYLLASDAEWDDWISQYEECYDAIKAVSPETLVFTTLQLEHLKGLGSTTAGWMDAAHWEIVDDLELGGRLDALGFTSYPYFEYDTPADIPVDYYDEISTHWTGPVIFTEIAWPAMPVTPFPGGELDQAEFPAVFYDRTRLLDLVYVAWLFLHDLDQELMFPGFASVGFRDNNGTVVRTSDVAWRAEVTLRQRPDSDL